MKTKSPGTDVDHNLFLQTGDTWCLQFQKMQTNPCSGSEKESNLGAFAVRERVSSWRFRGGGKRCIIRRELSALRTWLWPPTSAACLWPTRGFHQSTMCLWAGLSIYFSNWWKLGILLTVEGCHTSTCGAPTADLLDHWWGHKSSQGWMLQPNRLQHASVT